MEAANSAFKRPNALADLLPDLGLLMKMDRPARSTLAPTGTRTAEKFKPLTMAQLNAEIEAISGTTGKKKKVAAPSMASIKKNWNSSVKVNKKISLTGDGQMKHCAVRKALCFQTQTQPPRMAMPNVETPKFPKPEYRAKRAPTAYQARADVRVSGVYKIPQTPVEQTKPMRSRLTIANKENIGNNRSIPKVASRTPVNRKPKQSPKVVRFGKSTIPHVAYTPASSDSSKSSCDASFLQKEKEIHDLDQKALGIVEEKTLENIAEVSPPTITPFKEVSPPVSTPFNAYRNVKEFFNITGDIDISVNDTIMCFNKSSTSKDHHNNREDSVIVSLCDLLKQADVSNKYTKTDIEILRKMEEEMENNIKSQVKLLRSLKMFIKKKETGSDTATIIAEKTLTDNNNVTSKTEIVDDKTLSPSRSPILCRPLSVIRSPSKSPSYKIPKKNGCLRKKIICKSMSDISSSQSPKMSLSNNDRARSMYMTMKAEMEYLKTPVGKQRPVAMELDTPAVTKHNLQVQLDRLFNNS